MFCRSAYVPEPRTIQRRVREVVQDVSGIWGLADSAGEEARLILPVLAVILSESSGRRKSITREEAQWVLKVRQAAGPELSVSRVWRLASLYRSRKAADRPTVDLDDYLALAPWQSPEALAIYKARVEAKQIDPVPLWNLLVEPPTVTWMRGESWPGSILTGDFPHYSHGSSSGSRSNSIVSATVPSGGIRSRRDSIRAARTAAPESARNDTAPGMGNYFRV